MTSNARNTCRLSLLKGLLGLSLALLLAPVAAALEADQIVLIVNSNAPAGRKLAELYAEGRKVPRSQILELALPFPQDDIPFERYDRDVVPRVRQFLQSNGLQDKVTCLVTFYGVPLRIGRRGSTPEINQELVRRRAELKDARVRIAANVLAAERLAQELDRKFKGPPEAGAQALLNRGGAALQSALASTVALQDVQQRRGTLQRWSAIEQELVGTPRTMEILSHPRLSGLLASPITPQQVAASQQQAQKAQAELAQLDAIPPDAEIRSKILSLARDNFGLIEYTRRLEMILARLETNETESAFDSELSLLWQNGYPRPSWVTNLLYFREHPPAGLPPVLMVMRLDGPDEQTVRNIIESSLKVEKEGLRGCVAIDARGKTANDPYGKYDDTLRRLAQLVREKTKLQVTLDDKEAVFPPDSVKDVALYCGWYSLRHYVPAFRFNPGAVGFHVASLELVSLRGENEQGWVRGLLKDGVVATLGAVAEPYLHSFPAADEFFPLLMTGKLPLAEVYWKTTPLASWMNTCIGDPLYTPYKTNPAIRVDDLPLPLRLAARLPSTRPAPARASQTYPAGAVQFPSTSPATARAAQTHPATKQAAN